MTHKLNRLTARKVATEMKPGLHADGGGLYLRVGRGGAKSWCLRYMLQGKAREMGLGGLLKVSLAEARRRAAAQRLLLVDKIDPLKKREAENSAKKIKAARSITFGQCAGLRGLSRSWLAQCQARTAMDEYPCDLRLSDVWFCGRRGC